ncbi:MAG: M12 family metallopeptidase [Bryobacteraceae bacterium]|nr:M12 family metallopeptidase [Bryobacteraceae bacterium]
MYLIAAWLLWGSHLWAQDTARGPIHGWVEGSPAVTVLNPIAGRVSKVSSLAEDTLGLHQDADGRFVTLFRVHAPGASALRLHFDNFRLPEGAQLVVYGWSREHGATTALGPFEGAGPLHTGEFRTPAVPGAQAVVELHLRKQLAALPFDLTGVETLDAIEESAAPGPKLAAGEKRTSWFRGLAVEHSVVDNMGILEGDILMGPVGELPAYDYEKDRHRTATAVSNSLYLWPGGVVPYLIDSNVPNQTRISDAINHWNTQLSGHLRIIPRTNESYYLRFVKPASAGTCSSYAGNYRMAGQPVNIGDYCSTGNTIHEIGHAIGLFHEHTRADRDAHVRILTQNIQSASSYNFNLVPGAALPTSYDHGSIMHYGAYAFSSNGLPTIETVPAGIPIGQRSGLSAGDIAGVKAMYPASSSSGVGGAAAPPPASVNVTINSNPQGRSLSVDGQTVITPALLSWLSGSQHTISAQNQSAAGTRYTFLNWQDGAAQNRVYTVPSTAATLTANYAVQHQLSVSANGGGAVSVYPLSADGYYSAGTSVSVYAQTPIGRCFTGWTGLLPVSEPVVALQMTQPRSATANFTTGALTVDPRYVTVARTGKVLSVSVTANSGCAWSATSRSPWITIEGASTGSGSGQVRLNIAANPGGPRFGVVVINALGVIVRQQ